jgi:hypothetical protein
MMRHSQILRTLGLATCLPYVVWCLFGHWLHAASGCCHAHSASPCVAAHHHDDHAHSGSHCHAASEATETGASLATADEAYDCSFCEFVRQGVTPAEIFAPPADMGAGQFVRSSRRTSATARIVVAHPARGPPAV